MLVLFLGPHNFSEGARHLPPVYIDFIMKEGEEEVIESGLICAWMASHNV